MTINRLTRRLFGASLAAMAFMGSYAAAAAADLNALVWCDHADPNLLKPFEDANGIKVNVKEFEGTGAGLAIVEQSQPGDWDVMVIDSIDVRRGVERGLFDALAEDKLPVADLFPEVVMDQHYEDRRQALRHHREVRLQHHRLQQVEGGRRGHGHARRPRPTTSTRAASPSMTITFP